MMITKSLVGKYIYQPQFPEKIYRVAEIDRGYFSLYIRLEVLNSIKTKYRFLKSLDGFKFVPTSTITKIIQDQCKMTMLSLQYNQPFFKQYARKHPRLCAAWIKGHKEYQQFKRKG